ncbi:MAG: hypothetical protein GY950_33525, partial [bacterium]|nr:hypothetical protein [bacterium]
MIDSDIHRSFVHRLLERSRSDLSSFITGILFTSYFFSIFFSNTVVVLCMIPIIKIILEGIEDPHQKQTVSTTIILALIYGANIGGMGSLTGSPLNIVFSGYIEVYQLPGRENVTFFSWLLFGIPATLVLVLISRLVLKLGERGIVLDHPITIREQDMPGEKTVKRHTVFFLVNMAVLVVLTALQFGLKPGKILWGLNPIDILMIVYMAAFLFFSFIYPRGEKIFRKYKKNFLFLILFVFLFVPVGLVELAKDIIFRFRLKGISVVRKVDQGLLNFFNGVWFFFFKERRKSLKAKNPDTFVSLNRL